MAIPTGMHNIANNLCDDQALGSGRHSWKASDLGREAERIPYKSKMVAGVTQERKKSPSRCWENFG